MRVLSVVYQLVVGMSLLTLPWSRFWQENWFIWHTTGSLRFLLLSGAARGAVSGLGAGILLQALGWSFVEVLPGTSSVRVKAEEPAGSRDEPAGVTGSTIAAVKVGDRARGDAHAGGSPGTLDPSEQVENTVGARDPRGPEVPGHPPTT